MMETVWLLVLAVAVGTVAMWLLAWVLIVLAWAGFVIYLFVCLTLVWSLEKVGLVQYDPGPTRV